MTHHLSLRMMHTCGKKRILILALLTSSVGVFYHLVSTSLSQSWHDVSGEKSLWSSIIKKYHKSVRTAALELAGQPSAQVTYGEDPNGTKTAPMEPEQGKEAHHLFFLKVHKAASTTVMNVIYRFALSRQLLVVLPKPEYANILQELDKQWTKNAMPLPHGMQHFDIICNHLVFEEISVRQFLPRDAFFVGIFREPFQQFVSTFWYYREVFSLPYLKQIGGVQPISTYLKRPWKWESPRSYTHNRMSFDFGMDPRKWGDEAYVEGYMNYLQATFHLVMVSNRFDESILLLRRQLGWKVQDVIYLPANIQPNKSSHQKLFTLRERRVHKEFNKADYRLYEFFSKILDDKIRAAGEEFQSELKAFRMLLASVRDYCLTPQNHREQEAVRIPAEYWKEPVKVSPKSCHLMMADEQTFVQIIRQSNKEVARLKHRDS